MKKLFNKLKLTTEQEDIEDILTYYQEGGKLNEKLYSENLSLQSNIEDLQEEKEILEKSLKSLRERNNEYEKIQKDDVLEKYNVRERVI